MVSLVELSKVTEEGVCFSSPYDGKEILLTPEKSIEIQNALGNYSIFCNASCRGDECIPLLCNCGDFSHLAQLFLDYLRHTS